MTLAEQRILDFFGDPYWPDKEVVDALKEGGLVALYAVPCEQKDPTADEKC